MSSLPESLVFLRTCISFHMATGSGKSSLINAMFGGRFANVGDAVPLTQHYALFSPADKPVAVYDSKVVNARHTAVQLASNIGLLVGSGIWAPRRVHPRNEAVCIYAPCEAQSWRSHSRGLVCGQCSVRKDRAVRSTYLLLYRQYLESYLLVPLAHSTA